MVFIEAGVSCNKTMKKVISYGPQAWKYLNGVFCVFKPSGFKTEVVKNKLIANLVRDLNELQPRPLSKIVKIDGDVSSKKQLDVYEESNFADHPLVIGPRYQLDDMRLIAVKYMGYSCCGVQVYAVNDGCYLAQKIVNSRPLSVYQIQAKLGIGTKNNHADGAVLEKSTFGHVTQPKIDRVLAAVQAAHQRRIFDVSGVHPQTQEAYELASKGLIKPLKKTQPVIYGIKCIHFKPPDFTLEIHTINETERFLSNLVHEIGLDLKTNAAFVQMKCVRYGQFTLSHALLRKHWCLPFIIENIHYCKPFVTEEKLESSTILLTSASNQKSENTNSK